MRDITLQQDEDYKSKDKIRIIIKQWLLLKLWVRLGLKWTMIRQLLRL